MPPVPLTIHQTEEERADRAYALEEKKYRIEWLTFYGLAAYVVINFLILPTMLCANESTAQRFQLQQRPYVSLGREDGTLMEFKTLKSGQQE
jgi:hypothetical protein